METQHLTNLSHGILLAQRLNNVLLLRGFQLNKVDAFFGCPTPASTSQRVAQVERSAPRRHRRTSLKIQKRFRHVQELVPFPRGDLVLAEVMSSTEFCCFVVANPSVNEFTDSLSISIDDRRKGFRIAILCSGDEFYFIEVVEFLTSR